MTRTSKLLLAPVLLAAAFMTACNSPPGPFEPNPSASTTQGAVTVQNLDSRSFTSGFTKDGFYRLTFRGSKIGQEQNLSCLTAAYNVGAYHGSSFAMSCDANHPGKSLPDPQDYEAEFLQKIPDTMHQGLQAVTLSSKVWGGPNDVQCLTINSRAGDGSIFSMSCKF